MERRNFLRSSLILGGGLLAGDAVLEAFERLTHTRKSFPSAAVGITEAEVQDMLRRVWADFRERVGAQMTPLLQDLQRRPRSLYLGTHKQVGHLYSEATT